MEPTQTPKRTAKRKEKVEATNWATKTVALENVAHSSLDKAAKKLHISNAKFASAAILYFTESGLDPTAERPQGLASISRKVEAGVDTVRTQNNDIGNRLYALVRGFERTLYAFMQQQQLATYTYMESIESNLQHHLVALETTILEPMMEELFKAKLESFVRRIVGERTFLKAAALPAADWKAQHDKLSGERDQLLVSQMQEFIKSHKLATPQPVKKPGATPVPTRPVAPTPTAPVVAPASAATPKT